MSFYNKCEYLVVPNKRVIDDLLERTGKPDSESFTPYYGMNHLIEEQMRGARFQYLSLEIIKENVYELSINKLLKKEKLDNSEDLNGSVIEGCTLEEIEESVIHDFVKSQLIGLKLNKSNAKKAIEQNFKVQATMKDKDTGEIYNLSDDYVEESELEESYTEYRKIVNKIPVLLKKLLDGSKIYGVSLMSLFIARDAIMDRLKKKENEITPRELLAYNIYTVDIHGNLLSTFNPENANNIPKFRDARDVVLGVDKLNPYYRAGVELITLARQLGLRLADEDVDDYKPSYINNLVNSYILTNQEVLIDMAYADQNIRNLFKNNNIFKEPTISENAAISINIVERLREMAVRKMCLAEDLHLKQEDNNSLLRIINNPMNAIDEFFKLYKESPASPKVEQECSSDCRLENSVLCDTSGQPIIFNISPFIIGVKETPYCKYAYGILTDKGYIIRLDENYGRVMVMDVVSLCTFFQTKDINHFFKKEITL